MVFLRLFPLILLTMTLGCGGGSLPGRGDPRVLGAATVTAWARQGTVFPELAALGAYPVSPTAGLDSATSPSATPEPPTVEISTQPSPSSAALLKSMVEPVAASPTATLSPHPATPISTAHPTTPWPTVDGSQELAGRIAIPVLGIDVPMVEVSWHLEQIEGQTVAIWDTVAGAGGHHRGTAGPGSKGNCVISGHTRTQDADVFNSVWRVEPGDVIRVTNVQGDSFDYVVERVDKVLELGQSLAQRLANAALMAPTQDARLTLITCWPDWAYTHRLVIVARLQ
jgi:LPXTG-site transpeptidase (sortase) family protein